MNEKLISSMIKNLHAVESEGLSYAISEVILMEILQMKFLIKL